MGFRLRMSAVAQQVVKEAQTAQLRRDGTSLLRVTERLKCEHEETIAIFQQGSALWASCCHQPAACRHQLVQNQPLELCVPPHRLVEAIK